MLSLFVSATGMKQELHEILPGYEVNDYMLVLSPHKDLWEKIMKIKEAFADEFDASIARATHPQVTIAIFKGLTMNEERLKQRLSAIAMGMEAFKVEIRGFGSLPSHTIFFNVTSRQPIQGLIKELKTARSMLRLEKENPLFIDDPHIKLAMKLKPWQYEQAWLKYSNVDFTGKFMADGMELLKKPEGEKGFYLLKKFKFTNELVTTMQGELFL